jgi:hypothetical protein
MIFQGTVADVSGLADNVADRYHGQRRFVTSNEHMLQIGQGSALNVLSAIVHGGPRDA